MKLFYEISRKNNIQGTHHPLDVIALRDKNLSEFGTAIDKARYMANYMTVLDRLGVI